jgi:hypothetical protein
MNVRLSFNVCSLVRGGRLYRPNIRGEPAHHHLGRIDALLVGEARALGVGAVNEYKLSSFDSDTLVCDLFWDQSPQAVGQTEGAAAVPAVEPSTIFSAEQVQFNALRI